MDFLRDDGRRGDKLLHDDLSRALSRLDLKADSDLELARSLRVGLQSLPPGLSQGTADYLGESIRCIEHGLYRSAAVQAFSGAMDTLWRRILGLFDDDMSKFQTWYDTYGKTIPKKIQPYLVKGMPTLPPGMNADDWPTYLTEVPLMILGVQLNLYDENHFQELYHFGYKVRCRAAHPTHASITRLDVASLLQRCLRHFA